MASSSLPNQNNASGYHGVVHSPQHNARRPYVCRFRGFHRDFWVESHHETAYDAALAYDAAIQQQESTQANFETFAKWWQQRHHHNTKPAANERDMFAQYEAWWNSQREGMGEPGRSTGTKKIHINVEFLGDTLS